jgi:hypothetical protein
MFAFVTAAALVTAKGAVAQPLQLQQIPVTPQVLQPAQPEPSRLVRIQGGGLGFLDATAPDKYNLGLTVVTAPFSAAQSQQWLIASAGNGAYTIQQRSSGLYLDAHEVPAEAFFVVLRPRQTFDSTQLWRVVEYGGGFVTIQQVSSGRFLDATINAAVNYQVVTGGSRTQSQEWRLGSP